MGMPGFMGFAPMWGRMTLPPMSAVPVARARLVYNNDSHEHWEDMARSVTGFNHFSREGHVQGRDVLRLNGGDNNTGGEDKEWELNVRLLNLLGLHGTTKGNHEFDLVSKQYVGGLFRFANFPTLVSNMFISPRSSLNRLFGTGHLQATPRIIQGDHGPYALIGVSSSHKKHGPGFAEGNDIRDFQQTCRIVQAEVNKLRTQGINRIILLSHLNFKQDRKLAQSVSGISAIVGGDSHIPLHGVRPGYNYVTSPEGRPVLILQAEANGKYVGVADIAFDAYGTAIPESNVLHPAKAFPMNPFAAQLMQQYLPPKRTIAVTQGYDNSRIHKAPDALAQFTADAMHQFTGADIGIVRSREIRKNIEPGPLSNWDIKQIMPYQDPIVVIRATGAEILGALKRSAANLKVDTGKVSPLIHAAGLACTMNRTTGEVSQVSVFNRQKNRLEALKPNQTYTVALCEYAVRTREEFLEFNHPERIVMRTPYPMRSIFEWGLKAVGAPQRPIAFHQPDNRLQIAG